MNQLVRISVSLLLALVAVACSTSASAADFFWNLPSGEDWVTNTALWYSSTGTTGVLPGTEDIARVKTPGIMKIDDMHYPGEWGTFSPLYRLYVGDGSTSGYIPTPSAGHVLQTGGSFTFNNLLVVGLNAPGTSIYDMQGGSIYQADSTSYNADAVRIAQGASTAQMNMSGSANASIRQLTVGYAAGSNGTLNMSGNSVLTTSTGYTADGSGQFQVGYSGSASAPSSGTVNLSGDATLTAAGYAVLGIWNYSHGTMTVTDTADFIAQGALVVGDNWSGAVGNLGRATGVLSVTGDGTVTATDLRLGNLQWGVGTVDVASTTGHTATINVNGLLHLGYQGVGTMTVGDNAVVNHSTGWIVVGDNYGAERQAPGTGTFIMNGGTLNNTLANGRIQLGIYGGTGTWTQNGGTLLNNALGVDLGHGGGTATVNLNGGVFEAAYLQSHPNTTVAEATVNFNGGTLRATASSGNFIGDGAGSGNVVQTIVKSGGAIIDSNGFNLAILKPLLDGGGGGGLTKLGAGTLLLTNDSTYTGATSVTAGNLSVYSTGSLATSSVTVASGAGLGLADSSVVGTLATLSLANTSTVDLLLAPTAATNNPVNTTTLDLPSGASTLRVGAQGSSLDTANPYTVIDFTNKTGTGTINAVSLIRGLSANATVGASDVKVAMSGTAAGENLRWSGAGTVWDVVGASNWTRISTGLTDKFYQLDSVVFDDTGAANPNVALQGMLLVGAITESGSTSYTLSGPAAIAGATATLTKSGTGVFTLDPLGGVHLGGNVTVSAGTLALGANSGNSTFSGSSMSLSGNCILDVAGNAQATVTSVVSDDAFTGVQKTGGGTLVLANAANTYTGPTRIAGGTLVASTIANGGVNSSIGKSSGDYANLQLQGGTLHYTGAAVTTDRGISLEGDGVTSSILLDNGITTSRGVRTALGAITGHYLAINNTGTGDFTVTGSGTMNVGGALRVGIGGRNGGLNMQNSATGTVDSLDLGWDNGSNATFTMSGTAQMTSANYSSWGINGGSATVDFSGSAVYTCGGYSNWGGTGTVSVTLSDDAVYNGNYGRIGGEANKNATVDITLNNNAHIEWQAWLNLGEATDTCTVTMNDNSSITSNSIDFGWGANTHSTGTLSGTSNITTAANFNIAVNGANADGSVTLNESSWIQIGGGAYIGTGGTAGNNTSGHLTLNDDSTFTNTSTGWIVIGDNYGEGHVTINDTADLVSAGPIAVGNNINAQGTLTMTGDSTLTVNGFWVGNVFTGGGGGEAFLSDNAHVTSTGDMEVAWGGTGIVHIGDGTAGDNVVVSVVTEVVLGHGTATGEPLVAVPTNARVDLNLGGTLETQRIVTGNDGAGFEPQSSILNFNGGTLKATAASADFITNAGNSAVFKVAVQAGGAVIDTNGFDVTITTALTEDTASTGGGLTKKGLGKLTLTGDNTYSGDTIVDAGTLSIDAAMLDDDADLSIALGAVMDLNFTGTDEIASLLLNGATQVLGTWGSSLSGATNQNDVYFSGTGMVLVTGTPILIPGDTDNDQDVDADDAAKLAQNWGSSVTPGDYANGDFNGDGWVNAADASILAANWGNHAGEGNAAVPEPGMFALLIGMALAMVVRRRTRRP